MPSFSEGSLAKLRTCDPRLRALFEAVIREFDCVILEGHRDQATQDKAFAEGKSKLRWPQGKHNTVPSLAVDAAPYPIDWKDRERFTYFAGVVKGMSFIMGIPIRWGGDWDRDTELANNDFDDLPHFEIDGA